MAEILGPPADTRWRIRRGWPPHGGFKDWFISALAARGLTIEFWAGENPLPLEDFEPIYAKNPRC